MRRQPDEDAGFLNVDLDVYSRSSLEPLVTALKGKTLLLYTGRKGRRHRAHLELRTLPKNADEAIRGLAAPIRSLPPAARELWDRATTRNFNVGIQSAANRQTCEVPLSDATIKRVSELGGRILVTVYGARLADANVQVTQLSENPRRAQGRKS